MWFSKEVPVTKSNAQHYHSTAEKTMNASVKITGPINPHLLRDIFKSLALRSTDGSLNVQSTDGDRNEQPVKTNVMKNKIKKQLIVSHLEC